MTRDPPELRGRAAIGLGVAACLVLVIGIFGWAARATIASAVVAAGEVDAAPARHPVQHPEGGVVAALMVHEGDAVEVGQVLLRLDGSALRAEFDLVATQLVEAAARMVRLRAERDGAAFPDAPPDAPRGAAARQALAAQHRLFDARRATLARQVAQLAERRVQAEAELQGLARQLDAMAQEATILHDELVLQETLLSRGLAAAVRSRDLGRETARLDASRAAIDARAAGLHGHIAEIAVQAETLQAQHREDAEEQLAQTGLQQVELQARHAVLTTRIEALDLRAPASGIVHGLMVTAPGAVLRPAEPVMQILGRDSIPTLALRVAPDDIDHVRLGQAAMLRFPALAARQFDELPGVVVAISATTFADDRTGATHYRVAVTLTDAARAMLNDRALVPGMAVQAFLTTGTRTPLAYLLDPLRDHLSRAMREP